MGRGRSARTLELVEAAYSILEEIQPATVRAVCYRLFVDGFIPSMARRETARVSRVLVNARERDEIPWRWIVDETRQKRTWGTWADPESFADVALESFRRDRWQYQPMRLELWSEKGTIRGTLAPVLYRYGVNLRVFHGFSSATSVMEFVSELREQDRPTYALYVGDYDPSGLYMSAQDLPGRILQYGGHVHTISPDVGEECSDGDYCVGMVEVPGVVLERVALTRDDCNGLPSFDVRDKKDDPRYRWYRDQGESFGWELDAMSPPDLRERVESAILERIDPDAWERTGLAEAAEQASLREILGQWPGSISRQVQE